MSKNKCKTSIGGQAVIEGVMMRGKTAEAIAVRAETGEILVETKRLKPQSKVAKIPVIRGAVAFFNSLVNGTKSLMRSASVFGEDESSNFDKWLSKKLKISAVNIATTLGVVLGIALSLFLFFFLPQAIADLFFDLKTSSLIYCLIEGGIRIVIFIAYVMLTSLLKDIRRTFMYHGAEHKTISCYENGLDLTVENVKKCSRLHDRCGTTFMFLVMIISILVFALVNSLFIELGVSFDGISGKALRFLIKILTLPIISGLSYEVLKLLAKTKSKFFIIFKAPGLLLQKITTREPTDKMIEVAITSFTKVLEMDNDASIKEVSFNVFGTAKTLLDKVTAILSKGGVDLVDGEWIVSRALGISRSEISSSVLVTKEQTETAISYAKQRLNAPLAYVFGDADFYGYTFKVESGVLIPRPETEELLMHALSDVNASSKVLDLCTGSGDLGITASLKTGASVTLLDVSDKAIEIATFNANKLGVNATVVKSNLFDNLTGCFDVILSNPPYIKKGDISSLDKDVLCEPILALDGGIDGLDFYRKIADNSYKFLNNNGTIYLECGIGQASDIKAIFEGVKQYKDIEIIKDINGVDRILKIKKI